MHSLKTHLIVLIKAGRLRSGRELAEELKKAAALGCRFSQEQSNLLKSNDPAGFNVIDVLAWGSLGHALGYFVLATNSLQAPHVPVF